MVEIDHILPVSAEGTAISIADDMIDAEHEEQGEPGHCCLPFVTTHHSFPVGDEPTLHDVSNGTEDLNVSAEQTQHTGESATKVSDSKEPVAVKNKGVMSVNSPIKKANGSPPTPTVKKVMFSNTSLGATATDIFCPDHQFWYIWHGVRQTDCD